VLRWQLAEKAALLSLHHWGDSRLINELRLFCRNCQIMQAAIKADGDFKNEDIVLACGSAVRGIRIFDSTKD